MDLPDELIGNVIGKVSDGLTRKALREVSRCVAAHTDRVHAAQARCIVNRGAAAYLGGAPMLPRQGDLFATVKSLAFNVRTSKAQPLDLQRLGRLINATSELHELDLSNVSGFQFSREQRASSKHVRLLAEGVRRQKELRALDLRRAVFMDPLNHTLLMACLPQLGRLTHLAMGCHDLDVFARDVHPDLLARLKTLELCNITKVQAHTAAQLFIRQMPKAQSLQHLVIINCHMPLSDVSALFDAIAPLPNLKHLKFTFPQRPYRPSIKPPVRATGITSELTSLGMTVNADGSLDEAMRWLKSVPNVQALVINLNFLVDGRRFDALTGHVAKHCKRLSSQRWTISPLTQDHCSSLANMLAQSHNTRSFELHSSDAFFVKKSRAPLDFGPLLRCLSFLPQLEQLLFNLPGNFVLDAPHERAARGHASINRGATKAPPILFPNLRSLVFAPDENITTTARFQAFMQRAPKLQYLEYPERIYGSIPASVTFTSLREANIVAQGSVKALGQFIARHPLLEALTLDLLQLDDYMHQREVICTQDSITHLKLYCQDAPPSTGWLALPNLHALSFHLGANDIYHNSQWRLLFSLLRHTPKISEVDLTMPRYDRRSFTLPVRENIHQAHALRPQMAMTINGYRV